MTVLRLGTRGSLLAMTQSKWVAAALEESGGLTVELEVIRTEGDVRLDQPLHEISGQGVFTRELDEAVLGDRVQLAVHSLKDLPTQLRGGLSIAAIPSRVDPRDVLVGPEGSQTTLASLKKGAVVGTSSLRRVALLQAFRQDVTARTIRGNVDIRLRKLDTGEFDVPALTGFSLPELEDIANWTGSFAETDGSESPRLDERLPIECPHCGESFIPDPKGKTGKAVE